MAVLFTVAAVLVLGVGAQWIAWQYGLPSILLLLGGGFLAGPVFGVIDPALLQGSWVYPFVSVSVGIILFEGGLNLRLSELKEIGTPVRNLITIGVLITWGLGSGLVYLIEGFGLELALLTGAILVVTGPTVIIPLLRQIRPEGRVSAIAKWEGITIDPIGAILAVLVLEVILLLHDPAGSSPNASVAVLHVLQGLGLAVGGSLVVGGGAAALLVFTLRQRLVPDFLRNPLTLTFVVAAFVGAEAIQHEAGLLTTTLMGVAVANQDYVPVQQIIEFKENLQVLLIGTLFIVLSARLDPAVFEHVGLRTLLLTGGLVVLVRPSAVLASCGGTDLSWREQAFLAWLAPRGIVAAAMASLFAFDLQAVFPDTAGALVPVVFIVIAGTVALYGLTAPLLASRLGLADPNPQGILFVGAEAWVCTVASVLQRLGITVQLIDSNPERIQWAQKQDLPARRVDILSESVLDDLDLSGIGRLLIAVPNDEVASLVALHFSEVFETNDIFQLPAHSDNRYAEGELPKHLRGHLLFGRDASCKALRRRFRRGDRLHVVEPTSPVSFDGLRERLGSELLPMFIVRDQHVIVLSEVESDQPQPGDQIVMLARQNQIQDPEMISSLVSVEPAAPRGAG